MADDVHKDGRPSAQVYRLTGFGGGRSDKIRKDLGPYGGKAPDDAVQPNAFEPEDEYQQLYVGATRDQGIVQPPYNPRRLDALSQENNALGPCIEVMVTNVDGTGYDFESIDADPEDDADDENVVKLKAFFGEPWPGTSFSDVRKRCRRDAERTGNAYIEVLRNPQDEVVMLRWVDAKMMRMLRLDDAIPVPITVTRGGKESTITVMKRERRYCQLVNGVSLMYFKGTMSELELSMFRQRSQEALKLKARRGALILGVAAGYVKIGRDRIEKNPDKRVQDALQLVFTKFSELRSARQVHVWLREQGIELPAKSRQGEAYGVVWRLPAYNIVHNILTNPIYAGAYAFGRTKSRVSVEGGRKRVRRGVQKPMAEWDVLIKDHHAAYITWDEFERDLAVIANNATGMSSALARGAVREGELLLPGLLRCGHCGRKLHVHYGRRIGRYNCYGARTNHGAARCISISGLSIDAAISKEVLHVLKPLGIEAALKAIEAQSNTMTAAERQLKLSLQQARYEAAHARRQYDAVDPANRLVAGELELRWNEALQAVARAEEEITTLVARRPPPLGEPERQQLMALGADLERAWLHPAATAATRKRIIRAALTEIIVRRDGPIIHAILHWHGGDHTELQVKQRLNAVGRHNPRIPDDTIKLVRELARLMPDRQIARLLNRTGVETGYGNAWTQERVRGFRNHHDIAIFREGEWAERGEITLEAAAKLIGVSNMTALRMLRRGQIKGRQACAGAPWVIRTEDVEGFTKGGKRFKPPLTQNATQQVFDFQ